MFFFFWKILAVVVVFVRGDAFAEKKKKETTTPKVFVYPFPPSFAFANWYDRAYHFKKANATAREVWRWDAKGQLHWTPSLALAYGSPYPKVPGAYYVDQHLLGPVVHRALAAEAVDDPNDADLFYIPHHSLFRSKTKADKIAFRDFCDFAMATWLRHLTSFKTTTSTTKAKKGNGISFLERFGGRDHFVAAGRVWHAPKAVYSQEEAAIYATVRNASGAPHWRFDCPQWATEPLLRGVQKLLPEAQSPHLRSHAGFHPVPYPGFLFGHFDDWFLRRKEKRPYQLVGFLGEQTDREEPGKFQARKVLLEQCRAMGPRASCPDASKVVAPPSYFRGSGEGESTTTNLRGKKTTTTNSQTPLAFVFYREATFSLQPPGITAARKGIVDSLLAGCVPVLVAGLRGRLGNNDLDSLDQADLWPWHWPWQKSSSLTIRPADLTGPGGGLQKTLGAVPEDRLRHMRQVIRRKANDLAWPFVSDDDLLLKNTRRSKEKTPEDPAAPRALAITLHHLALIALQGQRRLATQQQTPQANQSPPALTD